jgi:hypothetical protein
MRKQLRSWYRPIPNAAEGEANIFIAAPDNLKALNTHQRRGQEVAAKSVQLDISTRAVEEQLREMNGQA